MLRCERKHQTIALKPNYNQLNLQHTPLRIQILDVLPRCRFSGNGKRYILISHFTIQMTMINCVRVNIQPCSCRLKVSVTRANVIDCSMLDNKYWWYVVETTLHQHEEEITFKHNLTLWWFYFDAHFRQHREQQQSNNHLIYGFAV